MRAGFERGGRSDQVRNVPVNVRTFTSRFYHPMKNSAFKIAGLTAALAFASTAQAALIAYNGFNGSPTGFSTDFNSSNTAGLTYSAGGNTLTTSGGAITGATDTTGTLTSGLTTGTVWMSFLVQYTATPFVEFARVQLQNGGSEMFQLAADRDASNNFYMSRRAGAGGNVNTSTGVAIAEDVTFLVVGRLNLTSQTADFWVNPTLSLSDPTSPQASFATTSLAVDRISLNFNGTANVTFDEIRLGTTFNDVTPFSAIPEPSSFAALTGLALLGAAAMRRRRG
jgi:hypothetical protein